MKSFNVWRKSKQWLAAMLAAVMVISPLSAYATQAVKTSNYVISKLDSAKTALNKLVSERAIVAAIYLKDVYVIKGQADQYSEDVAAISSGQTVNITGVDVDEGRNIWYKIEYNYAGGKISGYVEREFLACSDNRFLKWEDTYITTKNREQIRDLSDCSDIEQFPESYREALYELKKAHPNWMFVRQNININWNSVIQEETKGERNLISGSADSSCKGAPSVKESGWYNATPGIISYYMDPRNFLDEKYIFMFELESFNANAHSENAVQLILNGTFMSGGIPGTSVSYAKTFVDLGSKLNISPISLASRVKQEQGVQGTSALISGTYKGYENLYNYFNVKASGPSTQAKIENGLKYAKEQGWNTRVKSLQGGSKMLASNYVNRGQDTLYLQKFDVDSSDGTLYTHQYMQNLEAPYYETSSKYKGYKEANLLSNSFVFKIPVYDNMIAGKCVRPNAVDVLSLDVSSIENLPVDQNAVLISLINGGQNSDAIISYTSSNEAVATVDDKGVITGIKPGSATISAKREGYKTNTATCNVNVIKADIAISKVELPEISVDYSKDQTLSNIALPDKFSWVDSNIVPTVENEGYSVVYCPDNSKYNALTLTIPVNVARADISADNVVLPTKLTADAGAELSTVVLPTGYAWADQSVVMPKKTGKYAFDAYYCEDSANFNPTAIKIEVTVLCKSHEFGEWEGTQVDCINDGELERACLICGAKEKIEEKAYGHNYVVEVTKEATTTEKGIRTYTCSVCKDSYTEEIPEIKDGHKHNYISKETVKAGCLTNGEMTYTCECKDSFVEVIPALGHTYNEENVCKACGYELPVVPVHIHEYTAAGNTATCVEAGEITYTCGCGESYKEASSKLGHDIKNGECTRCDYAEPKPTVEAKPTEAAKPTVEPTVEAKPTEAAKPTETPKVTETPKPTEVPTATVAPTPTKVPEPTVEPTVETKPTEVPKVTEVAKPTEVPKVTEVAKPTEVPKVTEVAKPTETPKVTEVAKPTETPKLTEVPKPTDVPTVMVAPTTLPTPTKTPEPTTKPTPTVILVTEITPVVDISEPTKEPTKTENKSEEPVKPTVEVVEEPAEEVVQAPIEVVMMSTTVLDKDKIQEYTSSDNRKLKVTLANNVVWDIDLSEADIENIDVDLKVTLGCDIDKELVETVAGDNPAITMELSHDGEFGFPVKLHVPVEKAHVGKYASLFYHNLETDELEFMGEAIVSEIGEAMFEMEHASEYVIVISEESMNPAIPEIEDISDSAESVEKGILATSDNSVEFAGNNMMLLYIVLAVVALMFAVSATGMIIYRVRKKEDDDYYYDEED